MNKGQTERALLGAMLLDEQAIADAMSESLTTFSFSVPAHRHVFQACVDLWAEDREAGVHEVRAELERVGVLDSIGGPTFLAELVAEVPVVNMARQLAVEIRG